ncbi:lactonase family protein [Ectopseudomonas khazarica]|uniref:lactonase family protein n=1 Tax=Ectopseudomonas khazarica TaxID=2502979 RepID=UPI00106EC2DE|nr:lactonase family protein [Pseudomonas khazarica]
MFAYVGSRTTRERNARGEGISVFKVDQQNGTLEPVQLLKGLVNPSFLTLSRDGRFLYTVHGDMSDISAFSVDRDSGQLTLLNRQSTQGKNPVHLALDPSGRYMVVSNHISQSLAVLPVNPDGSLGELTQLLVLAGQPGPHRIEQPFPKPHHNPFDPAGRFVIVPDKGQDKILSYRFDNGRLAPAEPAFVATRESSGPRHLTFHPMGDWAYAINELDSTVTSYRYDASQGALQPQQVLSTLPSSFTGNSRASEIAVTADGRFLYASNRGFDSIAVFAIDAQSGLLRFVDAIPSGGRTPRFFAITPNGRFMFALNEDSDSIVTFAIDQQRGVLEATGAQVCSGSPVCMVFSA